MEKKTLGKERGSGSGGGGERERERERMGRKKREENYSRAANKAAAFEELF